MSILTTLSVRRVSGISAVAFVALLLTLTTGAWGQDNATITGTVADPSGAVVENVTITVTNVATGQVREVTSNSVGHLFIRKPGAGSLQPGSVSTRLSEILEN